MCLCVFYFFLLDQNCLERSSDGIQTNWWMWELHVSGEDWW